MDEILNRIDQAANHRQPSLQDLVAWTERQTQDQTYTQRLLSVIQRADLETRPPPVYLHSFLFRGLAYELASWDHGFHPDGCVWFPGKEAWILLRRAPVVPIISLNSQDPKLQSHFNPALTDATTDKHPFAG